jgi:hypothetical protein
MAADTDPLLATLERLLLGGDAHALLTEDELEELLPDKYRCALSTPVSIVDHRRCHAFGHRRSSLLSSIWSSSIIVVVIHLVIVAHDRCHSFGHRRSSSLSSIWSSSIMIVVARHSLSVTLVQR